MKNNNKTFIPTSESIERKWYLIDCSHIPLGRIVPFVYQLLIGKNKPYYYPGRDLGDSVILINTNQMTIAGSLRQMMYVYKPGRPGSSLKVKLDFRPEVLIRRCIHKMMPKKLYSSKRLKIYLGTDHPHIAQQPIQLHDLDKYRL